MFGAHIHALTCIRVLCQFCFGNPLLVLELQFNKLRRAGTEDSREPFLSAIRGRAERNYSDMD